ncbi:MAG: sigma-70 family RNA polymerase sigma factor [Bacteroidota bacterium]
MSSAETFLQYQPQLQRIAYNMVGCMKDAEDLVQDTFEKWLKVDHSTIKNVKAYLIQTLKNICINFLNSIRRTREIHFQNPLEGLRHRYEEIDFRPFDFEHDLSTGISELLQKLTLPEFSILILREGFEMDYPQLTQIFDKKMEHCRQLVSRAKKKIKAPQLRFPLNKEKKNRVSKEISTVCKNGNLQQLVTFLQKELERLPKVNTPFRK